MMVSDIGTIVEQKLIRTAGDLDRLEIIDWHRLPAERIRKAILSCVCGLVVSTIFKTDMKAAPERDDMPEWGHQPFPVHMALGRLYWNWFQWSQKGTLWLDDQPDFGGQLATGSRFYGDFGEVSPDTFAVTIKSLDLGDFWISVLDHETQVILLPQTSIVQLWNATMEYNERKYREKLEQPRQLALF